MSSLDEFVLLESMLQKSEDSLMKHQRKKHKSELINNMESNPNRNMNNEDNTDVEYLETFVLNMLNKHDDLSKRDEIIKKLSHRLYCELQDKEEIKKSENLIASELEDIRHQVKNFSLLVSKYKDNINANKAVKSCECQTDLSSHLLNLEDSLEICRRQAPQHSTMIVDNNNGHFSKSPQTNGTTAGDREECDANFEKLLLDQIKQYEEKIQSERQCYIEENERLNRIIEENTRIIDELKCQLKRSTSTVISSTCSTTASSSLKTTTFIESDDSKDYSRGVQGLFDWPIEESVGDQALAGDTVYDEQANAYNSTTNNRMLHVLSDLVKTFLDTENDIQKQLETLGLESKSARGPEDNLLGFPSLEDERISELTLELCEDGPDLTPSSMVYSSHSFSGTNDIEDDVVLGASRRLRFAVERVLKILSEVVEHHSEHDIKDLLKQKDELSLELTEEVQRRDKLTRQLLEKENLVHTLESEKEILSEQALHFNEIKAENEQLKSKLEEYERDRDKFITDHKRFESEKSTFSQGLPQLQQKLLHENESLSRDIRQLKTDKANLMKKINNLTSDVESLKSEKEQIIENKNAEFEELLSQIEANEKNLNCLKRFVEEQTQEREYEREEYNKEISTLKEKLKEKEKTETRLKSSVRSLENQLTMLSEDKTIKEEQLGEMSLNLKEANLKVAELNLMVRHLETDIERNNQVEVELRNKLKELSKTLDLKINDENNWDDLINVISKLTDTKQINSPAKPKESVDSEAVDASLENSSLSNSSDNSIFVTIKLMDDKIRILNEQVDGLIEKNSQLQHELKQTSDCAMKLDSIKVEMNGLEKVLTETQKENELLHQEINENHMKYSELKVKLESSVDMNEFKKVVSELQTKLQSEKKQTELVTVKLEQSNRHVHELEEKLDAYKKEIKSYKDLIKSHEHDTKLSKERSDFKGKYDSVLLEVSQLTSKVASKEKTISILEQNIEILKSKLNAISKEKDIYYEKLQSIDENQNKVVIYEKNLDKLRLQNKMSSDKINYLELEIKSLRKKIDILEKENDYLKIENQKLQKLRYELNSAAMSESEENVDSLPSLNLNLNGGVNGHGNGLYLNGLDKMNSISSNNLLMLKVRRLLSQKGALIYQKNYLIHLLGGFQMTENATLALLSNLNHTKDIDDYEVKMRGKQKFRSVAYALIALSRMRYMVNIWQCRKRQLLLSKTAHSMSSNLQNLPVPPKKVFSATNSAKVSSSSSSSSSSSPIHFPKHSLTANINSTMKDYVDRLHVVHETLGLHTNKL